MKLSLLKKKKPDEEPRGRVFGVSSCIGNYYTCFVVHIYSEDSTFTLFGKKIPRQASEYEPQMH
jgi:hypothetical protein